MREQLSVSMKPSFGVVIERSSFSLVTHCHMREQDEWHR